MIFYIQHKIYEWYLILFKAEKVTKYHIFHKNGWIWRVDAMKDPEWMENMKKDFEEYCKDEIVIKEELAGSF